MVGGMRRFARLDGGGIPAYAGMTVRRENDDRRE